MINSWFFNLAAGKYLLHKTWTIGGGATIPLFQAHLSDFLALPVLLSLTIDGISFIKKGEHQLSFFQILFAVIYTTFFMEYFAPKWSAYAIADWKDGVAYAFGGIAFYFAQKVIKAT